MGNVTLGPVTIHISATAMMKCLVALNAWEAAHSLRGREQAAAFYAQLCQYVMERPDTLGLAELAADVSHRLGQLGREQGARAPAAAAYSRTVRALVRDEARRAALTRAAELLLAWFARFAESPYMALAQRALAHLAGAGITLPGAQPFRDVYLAVAPPRQASTGQYVPWLAAVAVQMDTIGWGERPELEFIETLLHEQVHAIVHARMGDNGEHYLRLPWFNELTAILLSQYALGRAYAELRGEPQFAHVPAALQRSREQQGWGELATAVLRDTRDPLAPWRAWQEIFAQGSYRRRNYAHRELLPPALARAGWHASFPYHYGAGSVDCRDDWVG